MSLKRLQIPSGSGELDHIQGLINSLEINTLKKTNESLDSKLNTTLDLLEINYDVKISIEQKMNVTIEGVKNSKTR
ncbi:2644_t:CDS:2, partial [Racocetra fulgida]